VAVLSTGGSVAIGITTLALSFRRFRSLERRIEAIGHGLKDVSRAMAGHDRRVRRLEAGPR
jgi:hypothetical protein